MWENEFVAPLLPILAVNRGDWSASRPGRFAADETVAVPIQCEARWAQNGSEIFTKKISYSLVSGTAISS